MSISPREVMLLTTSERWDAIQTRQTSDRKFLLRVNRGLLVSGFGNDVMRFHVCCEVENAALW